ncbi:MarR family winged helix-turn-helix transcriptional regulator [Paenibacillus thalictri]|uniref:MarR family winged helix-turn-helix transcriptional regulator n=1 Tax=Paenibacillus thalictri TaxID=2527873 RepID=UPI0013EEEF80|nr:MarR family transcriptional regulator [Paenibacillus thalictri]
MTKNTGELRKLAEATLKLVKEFKHAQDRRADLDRVTFEVLILIKTRQEIRLTDIAQELQMNPSSITRRIQQLKQSGYIAIHSDPKDLRSSLIGLTDYGEQALLQFLERSVEGLARILEGWDDKEVKSLADKLTGYAEAMEQWRIKSEAGSVEHGE